MKEVEGLRALVARFVGGLTEAYTTMFARQPKYTVVSGRHSRVRFLQLSYSCSVHHVAVLGRKVCPCHDSDVKRSWPASTRKYKPGC
jgi:hypothetical protein